MRRQLVTVMFAGLVVICATQLLAAGRATTNDARETSAAPAPVAVQRVSVPATRIRDEAAMVLVGTALIGLAAAVRRAT
jgi:hypothetical protein